MSREVTADGITWSCIQALAGLSNDPAQAEAARADGAADRFRVVRTPSGRAHSVQIELPGGWEKTCPDD
jgi:hypothetical protein